MVNNPIFDIYWVLYLPGGAGFLLWTVSPNKGSKRTTYEPTIFGLTSSPEFLFRICQNSPKPNRNTRHKHLQIFSQAISSCKAPPKCIIRHWQHFGWTDHNMTPRLPIPSLYNMLFFCDLFLISLLRNHLGLEWAQHRASPPKVRKKKPEPKAAEWKLSEFMNHLPLYLSSWFVCYSLVNKDSNGTSPSSIRKYIDWIRVHVPAIAMLVDPGTVPSMLTLCKSPIPLLVAPPLVDWLEWSCVAPIPVIKTLRTLVRTGESPMMRFLLFLGIPHLDTEHCFRI